MELERPLVRGQSRVVELLAPSKRDYGRQYAGMYWYRLEALKMVLQNRVQQEWSSGTQNDKLQKLKFTLI